MACAIASPLTTPHAVPAAPGAASAWEQALSQTRSAVEPSEAAALGRLYAAPEAGPRWLDRAGRPSAVARQALAVLASAGDEGLEPSAYGAAALAAGARSLGDGRTDDRAAAAWDVRLSLSMLRYLQHLHIGRVRPAGVGWRLAARDTEHDYAAVLDDALRSGRLAEAAAAMAPPLAQYAALRTALQRVRALAAAPQPAPLDAPRRSVQAGDPFAQADALHARLVQLGDLPSGAGALAAPARYDGALVDGVRRFQARHGLAADGVLGAQTAAALNVPLSQRLRQLELSMERLRWLPHADARRIVAINIPMFRLWAWDPRAATPATTQDMGVIVGRALRTQTPVMVEEMRQVIFRPYWNVPRSILRNEILPKVSRDPSYLARQDMEIVRGDGDDAVPLAATPQSMELLRQGALRLRQRPGPRNSLGLVKFVFPNNENVYLHGTPAQELFARTRRDFSHGCVRVEDPVSLAAWVLQDQDDPWTRERIAAAMGGARPQVVHLRRPLQVVLFYTTAAAVPGDGALHFAEDIYRHDARLERALQALAGP